MPEQTTHKIEELKFKLKNDPKSRLFYPLAEELRKNGRFEEAEQYLRAGLATHASYLSAWVSLGRVLRETSKNQEAVEALKHALTVDPGNMVAARLLAETYYALGDKVESIKKYKLVHALLPADDEISAKIEQLHRELNPPTVALVEDPPSIVEQPKRTMVVPPLPPPIDDMFASEMEPESDSVIEEDTFAPAPRESFSDRAEETPAPAVKMEPTMDGGGILHSAVDVDHRQAMSLFEFTPPAEEFRDEDAFSSSEGQSMSPPPSAWSEPNQQHDAVERTFDKAPDAVADSSAYGWSDSESADERPWSGDLAAEDEITATSTMADLYAQQGHFDSAREIYERLLDKDPENQELKNRLEELSPGVSGPPQHAAVGKLQDWLRRIKGEAGGF